MKCRKCGKGIADIQGWLERVNEKGVPGIWECRPTCGSVLSNEDRIIGAIEGPIDDPGTVEGTLKAMEHLMTLVPAREKGTE